MIFYLTRQNSRSDAVYKLLLRLFDPSDIQISETPIDNLNPNMVIIDGSFDSDKQRLDYDCPVLCLGNGESVTAKNAHTLITPFYPSKLLNKVRSLLKQSDSVNAIIDLGKYHFHHADFLLIDIKTKKEIVLTEKERDILLYIHSKSDAAVSRQDLLDSVWGYGSNIETHTLETHIYRLRQKIELDPSNPKFLITDEEGYRLNMN